MSLRTPVFSLIAALTALSACDTAVPEAAVDDLPAPASAVTVAVAGARQGDFLYDLAPLAGSGRFEAALEAVDGAALTLSSTRLGDGSYRVALDPTSVVYDSVTVAYLLNETAAAPPRTVVPTATARFDGTVTAGTSEMGPDSYHYREVEGVWIIVKDYRRGTSSARTVPGTPFVTADGTSIRVSEVQFTLHGARLAAPEAVRFTSEGPVALASASLVP